MNRPINGTRKPNSADRWARREELHRRCTRCRHCTPTTGGLVPRLICELRDQRVMAEDTCDEFEQDRAAA